MFKQQTIGVDAAIEMASTNWWEDLSAKEAVLYQLCTTELCLPFDKFHELTQKALNRSVWTHEFAYPENILKELTGLKEKPTFSQILDLIPNNKTVLVVGN